MTGHGQSTNGHRRGHGPTAQRRSGPGETMRTTRRALGGRRGNEMGMLLTTAGTAVTRQLGSLPHRGPGRRSGTAAVRTLGVSGSTPVRHQIVICDGRNVTVGVPRRQTPDLHWWVVCARCGNRRAERSPSDSPSGGSVAPADDERRHPGTRRSTTARLSCPTPNSGSEPLNSRIPRTIFRGTPKPICSR